MTINVSKDIENAINAAVQSGQFSSAGEMITKLVRDYEQRTPHQPEPPTVSQQPTAPAHKPIWEVIQEITAGIPDEEWAKLPVDGAEQHDHYIYGTPKRPPRQ
jgi:Arc/MetJ-type ribon-helix-helix transcriptional regulator